MADLSSYPSTLLESDDISIVVHTLLQSSTLPSSVTFDAFQQPDHQQPPLAPEIRRQFCGSSGFPDSSSTVNCSSRDEHFALDEGGRSRCAFPGAIYSSGEGIAELDCKSEDQDASVVLRKSGLPRSSSKRTRAAEIHNLSEKKRRQRINEKMKALQKLIPNSNKTDKASMLDEAIEYLKQLQLQLQMLALRNGSALHYLHIPGVIHSAQPTDTEMCFNGVDRLPSSSRGANALSKDQKMSIQTVFNSSSLALETGKSDCPFAMEPSTSNHCRPFNFVMPEKLDVGCSGEESSSGISSLPQRPFARQAGHLCIRSSLQGFTSFAVPTS